MHSKPVLRICAALTVGLVAATGTAASSVRVDEPETVILTAYPKAGQADALAAVLARHWATAKDLKLVREDWPHVTLRVADRANLPYFVDVFTWRDGRIPDAAPAAILAIWQQMNALVESRAGRPGLDIKAATLINRMGPLARP